MAIGALRCAYILEVGCRHLSFGSSMIGTYLVGMKKGGGEAGAATWRQLERCVGGAQRCILSASRDFEAPDLSAFASIAAGPKDGLYLFFFFSQRLPEVAPCCPSTAPMFGSKAPMIKSWTPSSMAPPYCVSV